MKQACSQEAVIQNSAQSKALTSAMTAFQSSPTTENAKALGSATTALADEISAAKWPSSVDKEISEMDQALRDFGTAVSAYTPSAGSSVVSDLQDKASKINTTGTIVTNLMKCS